VSKLRTRKERREAKAKAAAEANERFMQKGIRNVIAVVDGDRLKVIRLRVEES